MISIKVIGKIKPVPLPDLEYDLTWAPPGRLCERLKWEWMRLSKETIMFGNLIAKKSQLWLAFEVKRAKILNEP